jgi:NTP pyrophosphatase (non-canonical NTP hydrolase)
MNFSEYQNNAHATALYLDKLIAKYPNLPEGILKIMALNYASNGLGEVGEVQGKVKKIIRDAAGDFEPDRVLEISKELGDCLWYIAEVCTILGLNMEDVAKNNIKKLYDRKERGVLTGNGDNR